MAQVLRALCDICGTDEDVETITVVYGGQAPWEADVCASHYQERFADLAKKGRRATRSNVRPQHRMGKLDAKEFSL